MEDSGTLLRPSAWACRRSKYDDPGLDNIFQAIISETWRVGSLPEIVFTHKGSNSHDPFKLCEPITVRFWIKIVYLEEDFPALSMTQIGRPSIPGTRIARFQKWHLTRSV
jgi:hypothetical protein